MKIKKGLWKLMLISYNELDTLGASLSHFPGFSGFSGFSIVSIVWRNSGREFFDLSAYQLLKIWVLYFVDILICSTALKRLGEWAPLKIQLFLQVYKFNVPTFGKDVVFDCSHKVRAEQFKMFSEALKISKMTDYVPLFEKEAQVSFAYIDPC